jgi:hypothetical protein
MFSIKKTVLRNGEVVQKTIKSQHSSEADAVAELHAKLFKKETIFGQKFKELKENGRLIYELELNYCPAVKEIIRYQIIREEN